MHYDRIRKALVGTVAAMALGAAATALAQQPLKVAFVYVSPIGDAGWTYQHDQGRLAMEKALGSKVTTKYIENVPEGADAERVIRELASNGYGLIYTTSFGYMNPWTWLRMDCIVSSRAIAPSRRAPRSRPWRARRACSRGGACRSTRGPAG